MGTQSVVDQVISSYPTYRKCHSSLYKGNYRNDNFTFSFICKNLVWGIILQGYSLRNVIPSPKTLHTGIKIYEVFKPTRLNKLRGCERNFLNKEVKNRRPRRLAKDILMPGPMTGVDLAREVRRRRPGAPILLTSGYAGTALKATDIDDIQIQIGRAHV